ncbi:hypothetical protein EW093_00085 [Thiospirochaeta perfilievii]|uniref:histidine kinase n=1 Tax=Thiospirochaeta perfilievii TaxID=252967 RepID=A0A5C1Q928_9SPIO|nr:ATP-binding protein [Thiospirochaeta perfilievii]QEN03164.1 hypothetical protein EW093_00085 [Thiospirochaeta perfilievii]
MLKKILLSLIFNGLKEDSGLRDKSRSAVLNSISSIGIIILSIFAIYDVFKGEIIVTVITASTALLIAVSMVVVGITKKISIGTTFVSYIAYLFFSLLLYSHGAEKAGYFWMMLFPLVSIFFLGIIHGSILTSLFSISSYFIMFHIPSLKGLELIPEMATRALGGYVGVSFFTVAFEIIRIKAFEQLEVTTNDLVEKRRQTTMILSNVKQGIFLLDSELKLADERSTYFNELFGEPKDNQSFLDLIKDKLPQRDFVATKDYLELFFNKTVNPTLLSSINPIDKILMNFSANSSDISQVWLEFDFQRIKLKDGAIQILGLFKDVTERVLLEEQLEKEESESLKNMESLFQIIHVNPELMDEFLKDTNDEINKINELLKVESDDTGETINYIFSLVHSIKGNALLLGLNTVASKLQDFEEYIKELKDTNPTWRELLKLTVNLAELKHDINQINDLIDKIVSFQKKVGSDVKNKKYIFEESLKKSLNRLGIEHGKEVELDVTEYDNDLIPEKYRRLLKDSINQFIRNSLAHGIEDRDERVKRSKDPVGKIKLSLNKVGDKIVFSYMDDGAGLSINNIKKAAIEKKGFPVEKVKNMTSSEAVKLIFHPGFSTKKSVNNLAGQGIGMSVIKNHVESVGGKLNIKSSAGKFCEFRIVLHE